MFGPSSTIRVVGHRGAAAVAPENTVESIEHAVAGGADAIEVDVHVATCGTLVTIHDDTLDRTTDGAGPVEDRDVAALRELDAGHNYTADFGRSYPFRGRGIRIPTLDETAEAAAGLPMVIEVKTAGAGAALAEWLTGRADRERFLVGGFERAHVTPAAHVAAWQCASTSDLRPMVLFGKLGIRRPIRPEITAVMVPVREKGLRVVTGRFVQHAHDLGVGVYVWTMNRPDEMRAMLDLGVDGLISDVPARARRILTERAAAGIA